MAFCINCGQELILNANFCPNCGVAVKKANSNVQRQAVYEGILHKCPSCGEPVNSFEARCLSCGHEFRDTNMSYNTAKALSKKLIRTKSISEREQIIRDFYIPNTKEDITEFIILITSNLDVGDGCEAAWLTKLEQAYQKAQLAFGEEPGFEYIDEQYNLSLTRYQQRQVLTKKNQRKRNAFALIKKIITGLFCFVWAIISGFFKTIWKISVWFVELIGKNISSDFFKTILYVIFFAIVAFFMLAVIALICEFCDSLNLI